MTGRRYMLSVLQVMLSLVNKAMITSKYFRSGDYNLSVRNPRLVGSTNPGVPFPYAGVVRVLLLMKNMFIMNLFIRN